MEMKWFWSSLFLIIVLSVSVKGTEAASAPSALPGTLELMLDAGYWIKRAPFPYRVLLTPAEIQIFNQSIIASLPRTMVDLDRFPDFIERSVLQRWMAAERMPRGKDRYADGESVPNTFYDQLAQNMNLRELRDRNPVAWGFTVRRTDLRTFPTKTVSSEDEESDEFDLFQESAVPIAEPLAVLHRSADAAWLFVQLYNYRGWVRSSDVALTSSRHAWQEKKKTASFLVITGTKVAPRDTVMGNPVPDWRAGMGTRLPLLGREKDGYTVEIPQRASNGRLFWRKAWVHGKADVSVGYLPYTRANILRQAFKMLGESYGWGGLNEGRDCSSFIMDIFRGFGIQAPRNADQQESVPGRRALLQGIENYAARKALLDRTEPGATLHMRNHVLLYLGQEDGKHFAIHSLGSYGDSSRPNADGTLPRIEVMKVVVGDLDARLRSGRKFAEVLSSTNFWRP